MTLSEFCDAYEAKSILQEWDFTKNIDMTPESAMPNSSKRVWWKCERGHEWQAAISDRTNRRRGCPYCAGKLPIRGENDLATLHPELADEWHPTKNGAQQPGQYTAGSEKKVWWQCALGHEWQSTIENRSVKGYGCPYCAGSKAWPGFNDLETLYPKLMKQWHPTLNAGLEPSRLRPGSQKRVYWICQEGHVWDTVIFQRTGKNPTNCPYCSGRLKGSAKAQRIDLAEARRQAEVKEERLRSLRRQRIEASKAPQS